MWYHTGTQTPFFKVPYLFCCFTDLCNLNLWFISFIQPTANFWLLSSAFSLCTKLHFLLLTFLSLFTLLLLHSSVYFIHVALFYCANFDVRMTSINSLLVRNYWMLESTVVIWHTYENEALWHVRASVYEQDGLLFYQRCVMLKCCSSAKSHPSPGSLDSDQTFSWLNIHMISSNVLLTYLCVRTVQCETTEEMT